MTTYWAAVAATLVLSGASAEAGEPISPAAAAPAPPSQAEKTVSPATLAAPSPTAAPAVAVVGTLIDLQITDPISTKTCKPGDKFAIRLASPIMVAGNVLVPAGAVGVGQIVDAAPSGAFGKGAKLVLAARYLDIDGVRAPLKAMKLGRAGVDYTNGILAASMIPYAGFIADFVHGSEVEIPAGTYASAKLASDFPPSPPTSPGVPSTPPPASPAGAAPQTPNPIDQGAHP